MSAWLSALGWAVLQIAGAVVFVFAASFVCGKVEKRFGLKGIGVLCALITFVGLIAITIQNKNG